MSNKKLMMTLAKVIIAAAWADGHISLEEINSLKDLLYRLPQTKSKARDQLTAKDWATLELYMHSPIEAAERARLIKELQTALQTPQDKALAFTALETLVQADGIVTETEKAIEIEIKSALDRVDLSFIAKLAQLIRGPVQRRTEILAQALNREDYLEDFIQNKIFFLVRQRLHLDGKDLGIPEADLRKLSMAGGLMARVAYLDGEVSETEFDLMVKVLQQDWGATPAAAAFVAEVAISQAAPTMDYFRLTREFCNQTSAEERTRFLDVLFDVALADGEISHNEQQEIRGISQDLALLQKTYVRALKNARQRQVKE